MCTISLLTLEQIPRIRPLLLRSSGGPYRFLRHITEEDVIGYWIREIAEWLNEDKGSVFGAWKNDCLVGIISDLSFESLCHFLPLFFCFKWSVMTLCALRLDFSVGPIGMMESVFLIFLVFFFIIILLRRLIASGIKNAFLVILYGLLVFSPTIARSREPLWRLIQHRRDLQALGIDFFGL